jgi:hypothetical protein
MFQALNGFLLILTCEGEVFFATHSIESYLGFHQVSHDTDRFIRFLLWFVSRPCKSRDSTASKDMMTDGKESWGLGLIVERSVICMGDSEKARRTWRDSSRVAHCFSTILELY